MFNVHNGSGEPAARAGTSSGRTRCSFLFSVCCQSWKDLLMGLLPLCAWCPLQLRQDVQFRLVEEGGWINIQEEYVQRGWFFVVSHNSLDFRSGSCSSWNYFLYNFVPFKYFCAFERLLIFWQKSRISVIPNFFWSEISVSLPKCWHLHEEVAGWKGSWLEGGEKKKYWGKETQ